MSYKSQILKVFFTINVIVISLRSYSQNLNLDSYVKLIKENNIDLKQSNNQLKLAKEESKIAKSQILPNASIDGFYQRDLNKNFLFINDDSDGSIIKFRNNFNNTIDLNATITQTIFDPFTFSTVKIAKLAEELNSLNNETISNEIITTAATLYWQAIFLKESIKVLEENSKLAKEQVDLIRKIYDKGVLSALQLNQTEALYKKTIPPLNNTKNQYENILNELKALANIPFSESIILTDNLETIQFNGVLNIENTNIENQPQIKTLKKEIEISEIEIRTKRKFWHPRLELVAGYNYNSQDNGFNFSNNENKLYYGQLRMSIPIFSGGSNKAEIAKAKIEKGIVELNLKNKENELLKKLKSAENNYNNIQQNIKIHEETIVLNEKEIEVFNRQLELGVVTPIEFKEARLRLIQSKLDLLNDFLDLHIAKLQIKRILGTHI